MSLEELETAPAEMSNTELLATLDDIVQAMCEKSHEEWAQDNSIAHRNFNLLKKELSRRLRYNDN